MNATATTQQTAAPIGKGLAAAKKPTKKPSPAKVTKPTAERDNARAARYPSAAKKDATKTPVKAQRADENTYETQDAALKAALTAERERAGIFLVKPGVFAVASRKTGIRAGWEFLGRAAALKGLPTATQGNKTQTAKKPAKLG